MMILHKSRIPSMISLFMSGLRGQL